MLVNGAPNNDDLLQLYQVIDEPEAFLYVSGWNNDMCCIYYTKPESE